MLNPLPWKEPQELKVVNADPQVVQARYSSCGKYLLAASYDARVRRWDLSQEELPEMTPIGGHGGWVTALACAPQDDAIFTVDSWGQLRRSTYRTEPVTTAWSVAAAHQGWIRDVAVSPDGQRVATCGIDKRVRIWSAADGKPQHEFATGDGPNYAPLNGCLTGDVAVLKFTADGQSLITGDLAGQVKLWNLATNQSVREFNASSLFKLDRLQDTGGVHCLAMDRDQKWLAVGGTVPKNGGTVVGPPTLLVFDFTNGELKHTLTFGQPNDCFVTDAVFHPSGTLIVTTSGTPGSGQLFLQNLGEEKPVVTVKKMLNIQSVSLHPDGSRLAVVATNSGSNGNGRPLTKDGKYEPNRSPIHLLKLESAEA